MRMDEAAVTKTDPKAPEAGASGLFTSVTPGWFETIGVPLLRGRDFTDTECENKNSPRVLIIDETMAKKLFPTRVYSLARYMKRAFLRSGSTSATPSR